MGTIVLGTVLCIIAMVCVALWLRHKENNEYREPDVDIRPLYDDPTFTYASTLDNFMCQLSAMWVEKYYLDHHILVCVDANKDKKAAKKTSDILQEDFGITDKASFEKVLAQCVDELYTRELTGFVKYIANQKILNKANEKAMIEHIMAEYKQAAIITQFYNLQERVDNSSLAYFSLYGKSIAAFVLRLSMHAGYCDEKTFGHYQENLYQLQLERSIDWHKYYDHWLLAHLFYSGCSYHDSYALHLRGIRERVNTLISTVERRADVL